MERILCTLSTSLLLFLISAELSTGPAFAQADTSQILKISPIVLKVLLDPGTTQTQTITVENLLDTPLPIRVSVEGFDTPDKEGGIAIAATQGVAPLANWITLDTSEALVPAKRTQTFEGEFLLKGKPPSLQT